MVLMICDSRSTIHMGEFPNPQDRPPLHLMANHYHVSVWLKFPTLKTPNRSSDPIIIFTVKNV